jgi:hypothetical protein
MRAERAKSGLIDIDNKGLIPPERLPLLRLESDNLLKS